jgi:ribonuclease HII
MTVLAKRYPEYGFERNKGYPSKEHRRILREIGPCPIHRRTFGPCRERG